MVECVPTIVARPGRDTSELGLNAINPTHRSWHADRAASIVSHGKGSHTGGDLGSGAARGATRRTGQVPGIVGGAEHEIIRGELPTMIRGIGFCENRTSGCSY